MGKKNRGALPKVSLHGLQEPAEGAKEDYASPSADHSERNLKDRPQTSYQILRDAGDCIHARAIIRDDGSVRTMGRTVNIFNGLINNDLLSEAQGWLFMACVKLSRSQQGEFHLDDYVDAAAYVALAGEAAAKENEQQTNDCDKNPY